MRPARGSRTSRSRSSPTRPRESSPALAPTSNWKSAHQRYRESSSSRYVTDSSTGPEPGTRAKAILAISCGASRFRLSARAKASTVDDAAGATAAALECVPGAYNIVDGNPSLQHVWLAAFARAAGAPSPPRVSEEEALRALGPDAVYYATRLRGASNEKARRELGFRPRPLEWI